MNPPLAARRLEASIASGDLLDVRSFRVTESMSGLYDVHLLVRSRSHDIDLEAVVGQEASFTAHGSTGASRTWAGICRRIRMTAAEEQGLSTYEITLAPRLWLLTQNTDYRIFQQMSDVDIALSVLRSWGIGAALQVTSAAKKRKYRVQYGETDFDFFRRMLEDAGVSFHFADDERGLVLSDAPQAGAPRGPIPFRDSPTAADREHVTDLQIERSVAPGKVTLRDHDPRRPPAYKLAATAGGGSGVESRLETYRYVPGAFVFESDKGERTPAADDKGQYRADEGEAARLAERRLRAQRARASLLSFRTNVIDLAPGSVVSFCDHPRSDIGGGKPYLVTGIRLEGRHDGEWTHVCEAVSAESPYHPEIRTPRPTVSGVESATVVGPAGEEIHTDELGRVRVHFHWDRTGKMDDSASCWIHVSQPWSGAGFGAINLPRVGQEVVVDFLGGDPDRPLIVGRVFTSVQRVPYKLPENRSQSGWRSQSTRGKDGYNEILFEDAAGAELFRVQAEKDLARLVKNDETGVIGRDRTQEVKRDDQHAVGRDRTQTVGRDRTETVVHDEAASVGNDRSRTVGNDEQVMIGNDARYTIANNESRFVGNCRRSEVAENETAIIGRDRSEHIGADETLRVGGERRRAVGGGETVSIAKSSARTIGEDESLTVKGSRRKVVEESEESSIGKDRKTQVDGSDHMIVQQLATRTFGLMLQETVAGMKKESIGRSRGTHVGTVDSITVGETFTVQVSPPGEQECKPEPTALTLGCDSVRIWTARNEATITMTKSKIVLDAAEIEINGASIKINAKQFKAGEVDKAPEAVSISAAKPAHVHIQGGDMVFINTPPKS
jgi:type VI secretion system secreted protein VgrG